MNYLHKTTLILFLFLFSFGAFGQNNPGPDDPDPCGHLNHIRQGVLNFLPTRAPQPQGCYGFDICKDGRCNVFVSYEIIFNKAAIRENMEFFSSSNIIFNFTTGPSTEWSDINPGDIDNHCLPCIYENISEYKKLTISGFISLDESMCNEVETHFDLCVRYTDSNSNPIEYIDNCLSDDGSENPHIYELDQNTACTEVHLNLNFCCNIDEGPEPNFAPRSSENSENNPEINIYPNPSNGNFVLFGLTDMAKIYVFNNNGQLVFSSVNYQENNNKLDLNHLESGIYFLNIKNDVSNQVSKLIIK